MRRIARVITAGLTALALMAQPAALVALDEEQPTPPAVSLEEEVSATAEAEEVIAPDEETLAPSDDTELSAEEPGESTELSDEVLTPEEPAAESDENNADAAVPQSPEQQLEDDPGEVPADPAREELDQLADLHASALPDGTYALVSGLEGGRLLIAGKMELPSSSRTCRVRMLSGPSRTTRRATSPSPACRTARCSPYPPTTRVDGSSRRSHRALRPRWHLGAALDRRRAGRGLRARLGPRCNARARRHRRDGRRRRVRPAVHPQRHRCPDLVVCRSRIPRANVRNRPARGLVARCPAAGTYYIVSSLGSHKVIDVSGGASWDGANVQLYASNGTAAQQWTVSYDANGYATITNKGSGKVLDVAAGKSNPGTNVQQFSSNGTRAQKMGDRAHFGHRQLPHPLRTRPKPRARHLRRLLRQRCQRAGLHGKRHGGSIVHLRLCRPCVGRPL